MDTDDVTEAFAALSQETRLQIVSLLAGSDETGLPAGDIALALGVPQNTLSFHLSHLERADLIKRRRAGRYIIYSANPKTLDALILYMAETMRPATMRWNKDEAA